MEGIVPYLLPFNLGLDTVKEHGRTSLTGLVGTGCNGLINSHVLSNTNRNFQCT